MITQPLIWAPFVISDPYSIKLGSVGLNKVLPEILNAFRSFLDGVDECVHLSSAFLTTF